MKRKYLVIRLISKAMLFMLLAVQTHAAFGQTGSTQHKVYDYDGDGKTDVVAVQAVNGASLVWHLQLSMGGYQAIQFGSPALGDVLAPADYDGDGKCDVAVWRPAGAGGQSTFYVLSSRTQNLIAIPWGLSGDSPRLTQDFDGDGKADPTVVRSLGGQLFWFTLLSLSGSTRIVLFGLQGDFPLRGDFDGDGKADISVYRGTLANPVNTFYVRRSSDRAVQAAGFGLGGIDKIVPADFDGDGKTDYAVFRDNQAGVAYWYWLQSSNGEFRALQFGSSPTDFPAPGDYDGDGKTDQAVWRSPVQTNQVFYYVNGSAVGFYGFPWGAFGMEFPVSTMQVAFTDHP
jgi:hypothetical protein